MLWSLIKILVFVAIVAALAIGGGMLMDSGEGLYIAIPGWIEINPGPLQSAILVVALFLAVWLTIRLAGLIVAVFRFLNGDETAVSRYFNRNRERRGYQALADGMIALASGEARLAMSKAARAEKFLNRPELTNLLTAQAAEMAGDRKKAEDVYKQLLSDDATRFVGVRGIMKQKLSEGDTDTALKLAQKAFELRPKHEEMQDTLLQLQAGSKDWSGARKTLGAMLRHGMLPRNVHKRRDAVLALSEAQDIQDDGQESTARDAAIEANRLSPDLVPAAALAARAYISQGYPKYATRVVKKAWGATPHPDLAAAFAEIVPDETPQERIARFAPLIRLHPDHTESRLLQAELLIAAEDFPEARRALGDLYETEPSARTLTLMAAIERGEGADDAIVRGWLTKALTVSRGPQWVCDNCQTPHAEWAPVCAQCSGIDTLSWRESPVPDTPLPASAIMLPLIVGTPEPVEPEDENTPDDIADAELIEADNGEKFSP